MSRENLDEILKHYEKLKEYTDKLGDRRLNELTGDFKEKLVVYLKFEKGLGKQLGKNKTGRICKMKYPIAVDQITPRRLLFNVINHCGGKVNRKDLMDYLYKVAQELAAKGYKVDVNFKGAQRQGWWSYPIDSEIRYWVNSGIIQEQIRNTYVLVAKKEPPFMSSQDVVKLVNANLEKKARRDLQRAIANVCSA